MIELLTAAVLLLHPTLGEDRVREYAVLIVRESHKQKISPVITAARTQVESRFRPHKISRTNDYGLMQLHVSRTTRPKWIGREKELLDPETNIKEGVKALRYWKNYHSRYCKKRRAHHWWLHYKYGNRVPGMERTKRARKAMKKAMRYFNRHTRKRGLSI